MSYCGTCRRIVHEYGQICQHVLVLLCFLLLGEHGICWSDAPPVYVNLPSHNFEWYQTSITIIREVAYVMLGLAWLIQWLFFTTGNTY
ncbi:hypothetical protein F5X99DRAFT_390231 [Biscogniauxia marginata]|nr:hypothetical protein F5X99DRAFT_390231 [Biscogniauxia marginata]